MFYEHRILKIGDTYRLQWRCRILGLFTTAWETEKEAEEWSVSGGGQAVYSSVEEVLNTSRRYLPQGALVPIVNAIRA